MLAELGTWWVRQMVDLLPPRWRARHTGLGSALVIDCTTTSLPLTAMCRRRRRHRETALGSIALGPGPSPPSAVRRPARTPVVLRIPAKPLECEVTLPLAAEPAMAALLLAELDRLTPFAAQEVFWAATVRRRDHAHGRLHSILSVVPKPLLAPLLAALEQLSLMPDMLETVDPDGIVRHMTLRPVPRRALLPLIAGASAALVLAAAVATPFVMQDREADDLRRQMTELRPRMERVQTLRRRVVTGTVDAGTVREEQRRVGDTMQVLATLTDLLPDDTFVSALTLRQRRLTISGQSAAAAGLIAMLSTGTLFRDPTFAAPVVRDPADRTDTFSLKAEVAQ
jgi:general secretion pathway protein L